MKFGQCLIFVLPLCAGCSLLNQQVDMPDGAMPVVRDTNWRMWKKFKPIQTVTFGRYQVIAPDIGRTRDRGYDISLIGFDLEKSRKESKLNFALLHDGRHLSQVTAKSLRKDKEITTKIIDFTLDSHDALTGNIVAADGTAFPFSINGFHSESRSVNGAGRIEVDGVPVTIHEIDVPWRTEAAGFAGAEFRLDGHRIGMVSRLREQKVWIDPSASPNVRTAVASVSATLLMARRYSEE